VSVGGASTMPVRGGHANDLLAAADEALYRAKHEGKNRAVLREMESKQESAPDA
jgi:two-component system chemotaxis family response regulator WspR